MNVELARKRHESFCLHYMTTMNGSQAALAAGYSARNPKNAHIIAWTLLKREDIQARLKELREATADEAIMSIIERKRRLSEIARARYDDPDHEGDPIEAIRQLNLMDGIYRSNPKITAPVYTSNVVVVEDTPLSGDGKQEQASE